MKLDTIIDMRLATSFRIGSLYVPANSVEVFLHRFIDPALFYNDPAFGFEFSKSGSLTKVKFKGRYFALLTFHQVNLGRYALDQLFVKDRRRKMMFTSSLVFHENFKEPDHEKFDFLAFEFTESVLSNDLPNDDWYDLDWDADFGGLAQAEKVICIGYPSDFNSIEFGTAKYEAKAVSVFGTPKKSAISRRLSFVPDRKPKYGPSGMSGGGVFAVAFINNEPRVAFAGILTEATKEMFNLLSSREIRKILTKSM
jgi:hypothetical protein